MVSDDSLFDAIRLHVPFYCTRNSLMGSCPGNLFENIVKLCTCSLPRLYMIWEPCAPSMTYPLLIHPSVKSIQRFCRV